MDSKGRFVLLAVVLVAQVAAVPVADIIHLQNLECLIQAEAVAVARRCMEQQEIPITVEPVALV